MVELAFNLEEVLKGTDQGQPEPDAAAETEEVVSTAYVDPARGVFITSKGDEVQLSGKRITALLMDRVGAYGKPKPPDREVMVLGKPRSQPNPNDEGYLAELAEWKETSQLRQMQYAYTIGVKGQPPEEFIADQQDFFTDLTDIEMKYLWVASLIPNEDVGAFTEAVMGFKSPTTKGLDEAANFTESP